MDYPDYENDIFCPQCGSTDIEEISEDEKVYGIGLYEIYNFIGGINQITNQYQCSQCHYQF